MRQGVAVKIGTALLWFLIAGVVLRFAFIPVVGDSSAWYPYFVHTSGMNPLESFFAEINNPRSLDRPTPFWMTTLGPVYTLVALVAQVTFLDIWIVQGLLKLGILGISVLLAKQVLLKFEISPSQKDFLLFSLVCASLITLHPVTTSNSWVYYPLTMLTVVPLSLVLFLVTARAMQALADGKWTYASVWLMPSCLISSYLGGTYELYVGGIALNFFLCLTLWFVRYRGQLRVLGTIFLVSLPGLAVFVFLRISTGCSGSECGTNQTLSYDLSSHVKNLSLVTIPTSHEGLALLIFPSAAIFALVISTVFRRTPSTGDERKLFLVASSFLLGAIAVSSITAFSYEAEIRAAAGLAMTPYRSGAPASLLVAMGVALALRGFESIKWGRLLTFGVALGVSWSLAISVTTAPLYANQIWSSERTRLENAGLKELLSPTQPQYRCEIHEAIAESPTRMQKIYLRDIDKGFERLHGQSFCPEAGIE